MRPKERIDVFLGNVDLHKLIVEKWGFEESQYQSVESSRNEIRTIWLQDQDLRFSQVLVNNDWLPNKPGFWYYDEETSVLLEQGVEPRNCLLWGTYGKNPNVWDPDLAPKYKLIKTLSDDHIQAILDTQKQISDLYRETFEKELKLRKEGIFNSIAD